MEKITKVGIVGTGFIAKGLFMAIDCSEDLLVSKVLTRTKIEYRSDFPGQDLLTNSVDELIDNSDLIIECSGDVIHATDVIDRVMSASLPVITMDAELHVTTGSYFTRRGFITEAEGDQPGCIAALSENVVQMGFKPLVYGNIKGFLNNSPSLDDMEFWAKKQNISVVQTISFTDGTKVQIEQALVANGLGAGIAVPGLLGIFSETVGSVVTVLAERAKSLGYPLSDYVLSPKSPAGVFIIAEHDKRQREHLKYYKMGNGPYYLLMRNFHLCHLEITKTVRRVLNGGGVLLNNTENPAISVAAIAKMPLKTGYTIRRGVGSLDVRGIAVRIAENQGHVPIGLLENAVVTRRIETGQLITFDDVEIRESLALRAWRETIKNI